MSNEDIVKYFYEVVVSEILLNELPQFISEDCYQMAGESKAYIGIDGMRQHLEAIRITYPDIKMKIIRQFEDDDTLTKH